MKDLYLILLITSLLGGCYVEPDAPPEFPVGEVQGYEPVYFDGANAGIAFGPARSLSEPGKIYVYKTWLLINERYQGIHWFDNTDPSHPRSLGFLSIPGNIDLAVRSGILYADHLGDLVALDISNWQAPRELSRVHLASWKANLPPEGRRYFSCIDPGRGVVVGWRLTTLHNPKCFH
jgi:hypothetical protein